MIATRPKSPKSLERRGSFRGAARLSLLGLGFLAFIVGGATAPVSAQEREEPTVLPTDEVTEVLLQGGELGAMSRGLARLGPARLPQMVEILERGGYGIRLVEVGLTRRMLAPKEREAIFGAFGLLPPNEKHAFLASVAAAPEWRESERRTVIEILARIGLAEDMSLLGQIASPAPGESRVPLGLRRAYTQALDAILARNPAAGTTVRQEYGKVHQGLVAPIVEALARTPSTERLAVMSALLGRVPEVDLLLLLRIGDMAGQLRHPLPEALKRPVRSYLWSSSSNLAIEAVGAVADLEDTDAVPMLIDVMQHDDRRIGDAARRSLETIAGRILGSDPTRWQEWYEQQVNWWDAKAPYDLQTLRGGDVAQRTHVVLQLSKRKFFRHQLTEPIAAGLGDPHKDFVVVTCATLGHLGSWTAVPHLIGALGHEETEVQAAAWRALRRITGEDLGPDPALWEALWKSDRAIGPAEAKQ